MALRNMPEVKMGIVAVSRDCFPKELSEKRLKNVVAECGKQKVSVIPCSVVVESEVDAMKAVAEMKAKGANAMTVYLGNFGPEGPIAIFAREMGVPFMLCAAAEETCKDLIAGRGDAYCGMLSACLNAGLRNVKPYLPHYPIGTPDKIAKMIAGFNEVVRVVIGVRNLKIISFGPRPNDFFACDAPLKPLYDLGVEVMENSEMDLHLHYKKMADRTREIDAIAADMARELGAGNKYPDKLKELAQFELALIEFYEKNLGARKHAVFANKCWPGFEPGFGFVPCYVNSRMAMHGIPVACETDIYGAISEYICQTAVEEVATLLDINNSVPDDLPIKDLKGADREDLFMGFHCGNTASCTLCSGCSMKYQLIMARLMEPGKTPNITVGTLEGTLRPGPLTIFRLQASPTSLMRAFVADGHVIDADPASFGAIGIVGIKDFGRFYRHVLLGKMFPHHAAFTFKHAGKVIFDAMKLMGVEVSTPLPAGTLYPDENPFGG
jgi:L-fucose isomerase-like protein